MIIQILNSGQSTFLKSERESAKKIIADSFADLSIAVEGNPDVIEVDIVKLGIEDARRVRSYADSRPIQMERKVIVIYFDYITDEAQNALLKVLEEPGSSEFILVSERGDQFIPTLRSRLLFVDAPQTDEHKFAYILTSKKSIADNMKVVENIVADYKDEKVSKIEIEKVLRRLLKELEKKDSKNVATMQTLRALSYLHDTSSSVKILLESVVVLL